MIWFFGVTFVVALAITAVTQGMKNLPVDAALLGRFILTWLVVMVLSAVLVLIWFLIAHRNMLGAIN
jgi:hypothetical protein